jgi:para-aminobenzoate synthetase/4-amino-4-deoxychorismate lyase
MPDDSAGVIQRRIDCALDPLEVLARLGGRPGLTGLIGSWAGGGALITSDPVRPATSISDIDDHPMAAADRAGFVGGGWFGVLGYQLGRCFENLPAPPSRPTPVPELRMSYFDHVLRYDAEAATRWFESVADRDRAERHYREIVTRLRGRVPTPYGYQFGPFRMAPAPAAHQDAVARCLEYIAAGDIFQANICLQAAVSFQGEPLAAFVRGVRECGPHTRPTSPPATGWSPASRRNYSWTGAAGPRRPPPSRARRRCGPIRATWCPRGRTRRRIQ